METKNLDALMVRAAQECPGIDDCICEDKERRDKIFRAHGPAMVAVLKMVPIIIDHDPNAPLCHANQLRQECINLLAQLDRDAK